MKSEGVMDDESGDDDDRDGLRSERDEPRRD